MGDRYEASKAGVAQASPLGSPAAKTTAIDPSDLGVHETEATPDHVDVAA
jgi:hypothetical protein